MSKVIGMRWWVEWSRPYSEPPNGENRVRIEKILFDNDPNFRKCPPEVEKQSELGKWSVYCCAICKPNKTLNQEQLSSIRKKRLKRRIETKYPLFANEIIEEEMNLKKDYYDGKENTELESARQKIIDQQNDVYQHYLEVTGKSA